MKIWNVCLMMLCYNISAYAQTLKGTIVDQKNQPVFGAIISIDSLKTKSKEDGSFELLVKEGFHTFHIKSMGYSEVSEVIILKKGETKTRNFTLEPAVTSKEIVVISGGKYAKKFEEEIVSMEVLKANIIQNNNGRINEAVNKIPGLTLIGETPSVRGGSGYAQGSASRLLVLLDDMPALSPENAAVRWEMLPTDNIEQIELIKGASSCLYGSSALNGVMNIRTANAKSKPQTTIAANYGLYDKPSNPNYATFWKKVHSNNDTTFYRPKFYNFSFADLRRIGRFEISEGANFRYDESHLQYDDKVRFRNNLKLKYKPKNDRITFSINNNFLYEKGNYFFLWLMFPNLATDDLYSTIQINPTKSLYYNIDPIVSILDKKGNTHTFKNRYMFGNYVADGQNNNTHSTYHEYVFKRHFDKINLHLIAGAAANLVWTDGIAIQKKSSLNISEYVQADKKFLNQKLTVSAGLRLEYFKVDSIQTTYQLPLTKWNSPVRPVVKIGMNYKINDGMFIRASWGEGYRFPTLSELYIRSISYGFPLFPNTSLKPESGWNAELGYKLQYKVNEVVGYFDVAGFYTRYYDMTDFLIGPGAGPNGESGVKTINVDNAGIYGFELSALGQGKIKQLEINYLMGFTFVEPRNLDHNPNDTIPNPDVNDKSRPFVSRVPLYLKYRNKYSFKADIECKYKKILFGASVVYNSHIIEMDRDVRIYVYNTEGYRRMHNSGYVVLDSRFGYQMTKNLQWMLNCKNILNEEYTIRPAKIEAPRNFTVSLIAKF